MKDKMIRWHVVDSKGKDALNGLGFDHRLAARSYKKSLIRDMFMEWNKDINYPIHVERVEWRLHSKEKVR